MKLLLFVAIIFASISLECQSLSDKFVSKDSTFAFYFLRNSTIATHQILNLSLDSLVLASAPVFTALDIKTYSWSTHTFFLKPKIDSISKVLCTIGSKSHDIPFVIKVGSERIYLGEFNSPSSSLSPQCAYISMGSDSSYKLNYSKLSSQPDKRSDKRIHDALQVAGVLIE
jgi:hypothetical protein